MEDDNLMSMDQAQEQRERFADRDSIVRKGLRQEGTL